MSIWDGFDPPTLLRDDGKYTDWNAPQGPFSAEDFAFARADMLKPPVYRAPVVRASLYCAHRRRWLAHLLSLQLGYRSTPPPFGCVA